MSVVFCREAEFRERAMWHGADTFVEVADMSNVIPFRLVAMRDGVPGPIATYAGDGTTDAWLWSDAEPLLITCDELDEAQDVRPLSRIVGDWATAALLLVLCGVLTAIFVGFGG